MTPFLSVWIFIRVCATTAFEIRMRRQRSLLNLSDSRPFHTIAALDPRQPFLYSPATGSLFFK